MPFAVEGDPEGALGLALWGDTGVVLGTNPYWTDPPRKLAGEQLARIREATVNIRTFFISNNSCIEHSVLGIGIPSEGGYPICS
jgi:hypothetical protein